MKSGENKTVQSDKPSTEKFAQRFKSLCDEMGYQLVATPVWIARDDGTFSMKINWSIGELPKAV